MTGLILTHEGEIKEVQGHMVSRGQGVVNCYAQTAYGPNGPQTKAEALAYMNEMKRQQAREKKEYGQ